MAYRLVEELIDRYKVGVTVIMTPAQRQAGRDFTELAGIRVLVTDHLHDQIFLDAGVERAAGLALAAQDDVGNIHAAMRAQDLNPRLRIVIRMFNTSLGHRIRVLFQDCAVVSDSAIAAPAFVEAALGDGAPSYFRHAGRTLYAARRAEVLPRDVMAGLARTAAGQAPVVLPEPQASADTVLAVAHGEAQTAAARAAGAARRKRRWGVGAALRTLRGGVSRTMRWWLSGTALVLILGAVGLAFTAEKDRVLSPWEAIYQTMVTAFSGAERADNAYAQIAQIAIMVAGLVFVPLITAAIVQASVNTKLALNSGRLLAPTSGHVVVVGLGNVGTRVIRTLHDLGVPMVAVDREENARGVAIVRELGIPFVVGDASRSETLRAASVRTCKAIVIVSTNDVVNLETALQARAAQPGLKVVLRLFESDLAERIQRAFSIGITRSVSSIAAPAFAAALMEREVIATIPVGRRVLLVAEVPIGAGSALAGAPIDTANRDQECRVIAMTAFGEPRPLWQPAPERTLVANDRLTVVTTRAGLSNLLSQASSPTDPVYAAAGADE